jgi:hypothetical protein
MLHVRDRYKTKAGNNIFEIISIENSSVEYVVISGYNEGHICQCTIWEFTERTVRISSGKH